MSGFMMNIHQPGKIVFYDAIKVYCLLFFNQLIHEGGLFEIFIKIGPHFLFFSSISGVYSA